MKSKILTSMVVACAFALVNCDDSTSAVQDALPEQGVVPGSSSDGLTPATTPEISSSSIVGGGDLVPPTSSVGGEMVPSSSAPASSGQQNNNVAGASSSSVVTQASSNAIPRLHRLLRLVAFSLPKAPTRTRTRWKWNISNTPVMMVAESFLIPSACRSTRSMPLSFGVPVAVPNLALTVE